MQSVRQKRSHLLLKLLAVNRDDLTINWTVIGNITIIWYQKTTTILEHRCHLHTTVKLCV